MEILLPERLQIEESSFGRKTVGDPAGNQKRTNVMVYLGR
jgi:hypothetical protein